MIPQQKLSLIANNIYKNFGGQRVSENVLERDYCLGWLLIGLARSRIKENLIFKGGTALRRCYFHDYRFSEDLDFTLKTNLELASIISGLEEVYALTKEASGIEFGFSRFDSQSHLNSYTFYLWYKGPLPNTAKAKEIKVDITIQELIINKPCERKILNSYPEYDFPENKEDYIFVYALEEVILEKSLALFDSARSEPRDLFDFWYLTTNEKIDLSELPNNMLKKLEFKKKTGIFTSDQFEKKKKRLEIAWEKRLRHQMINLPEFDGVYRAVLRSFRQALNFK